MFFTYIRRLLSPDKFASLFFIIFFSLPEIWAWGVLIKDPVDIRFNLSCFLSSVVSSRVGVLVLCVGLLNGPGSANFCFCIGDFGNGFFNHPAALDCRFVWVKVSKSIT